MTNAQILTADTSRWVSLSFNNPNSLIIILSSSYDEKFNSVLDGYLHKNAFCLNFKKLVNIKQAEVNKMRT